MLEQVYLYDDYFLMTILKAVSSQALKLDYLDLNLSSFISLAVWLCLSFLLCEETMMDCLIAWHRD